MACDGCVDSVVSTVALLIALAVVEDPKPWPVEVVDLAISEYGGGFLPLLDCCTHEVGWVQLRWRFDDSDGLDDSVGVYRPSSDRRVIVG